MERSQRALGRLVLPHTATMLLLKECLVACLGMWGLFIPRQVQTYFVAPISLYFTTRLGVKHIFGDT